MSEVLNQRYLLTNKLGQGGFGAVYQATDLLLDREVAVKVLNIKENDEDDLVSRFLTEAKIASKLNHPNTLTIYDFGRNQENCCYLVSELLLGESLHEHLGRTSLSVSSSLEILYRVALALKEAHFGKIVHRDIKPANIFLHKNQSKVDFTVKLLDFGIAKMLEGTSHTITGQMMGTPHYMSPEQIINIKLVDHRTDIYSLGVVFYHMLMGSVPYDDDSYYAIMRHHMQSPMPILSIESLSEDLLESLQRLLTQMTVKDVRKRINSIDEVIQKVQAVWNKFPNLKQDVLSIDEVSHHLSDQTKNDQMNASGIQQMTPITPRSHVLNGNRDQFDTSDEHFYTSVTPDHTSKKTHVDETLLSDETYLHLEPNPISINSQSNYVAYDSDDLLDEELSDTVVPQPIQEQSISHSSPPQQSKASSQDSSQTDVRQVNSTLAQHSAQSSIEQSDVKQIAIETPALDVKALNFNLKQNSSPVPKKDQQNSASKAQKNPKSKAQKNKEKLRFEDPIDHNQNPYVTNDWFSPVKADMMTPSNPIYGDDHDAKDQAKKEKGAPLDHISQKLNLVEKTPHPIRIVNQQQVEAKPNQQTLQTTMQQTPAFSSAKTHFIWWSVAGLVGCIWAYWHFIHPVYFTPILKNTHQSIHHTDRSISVNSVPHSPSNPNDTVHKSKSNSPNTTLDLKSNTQQQTTATTPHVDTEGQEVLPNKSTTVNSTSPQANHPPHDVEEDINTQADHQTDHTTEQQLDNKTKSAVKSPKKSPDEIQTHSPQNTTKTHSPSSRSKNKARKKSNQEIKLNLSLNPSNIEYEVGETVTLVSSVYKGSKRMKRHLSYRIPRFVQWVGSQRRKIKFVKPGKSEIKLCYKKTCKRLDVKVVAKNEDDILFK